MFGGGGIRGMCYIGAIKALQEFNIEIDSVAGSSVGAVFAALFAVGYQDEEIKELFYDFNINIFRDINISMFTTDISISKGEIFLDWLREKIEKKYYGSNYKKGNNPKVRFKDIEKDLNILTIDLNTNTPYIFSKTATPNEEIAFAVRASASLPGLMKPVNKDNAILVDGDLIKSWPSWKIFESFNNSDNRLLEFRLEGSRKSSEIKNPVDYLNSIINTIWFLSTENVFNLYHQNDKYDYIVIDTKEIILFDFTIEKSIKNELIEKGYEDTKKYFSTVLPEKKKNIINHYKEILKRINIFKSSVNEDNVHKAIYIINDILAEMPDKLEFINKCYYTYLLELKSLTLSNIKTVFLFQKKFSNEKLILQKTEFIINRLNENILELYNYVEKYCNNF